MITRSGLDTFENHLRLSPVLISQAGLHTGIIKKKRTHPRGFPARSFFLLPVSIIPFYAGWAGIAIFMWIFASGPVLKNRELRREVVGRYIYPQLEISQCKTEQERREFVQAFIDEHYKDDEEEEDDE